MPTTAVQRLLQRKVLGNARQNAAQARGTNPAAGDGISNLQEQVDDLLQLTQGVALQLSVVEAEIETPTFELPMIQATKEGV